MNATGKLRLSPNEEAFILKEDYERRQKLRLLQVREQERDIALQIREDIKQEKSATHSFGRRTKDRMGGITNSENKELGKTAFGKFKKYGRGASTSQRKCK